jgi:hypothetical protein
MFTRNATPRVKREGPGLPEEEILGNGRRGWRGGKWVKIDHGFSLFFAFFVWNSNWLSGGCSEVYECSKNAVGLQNTAKYCNQIGQLNRISNEQTHAVSRFKIGGSGSVMHCLAP